MAGQQIDTGWGAIQANSLRFIFPGTGLNGIPTLSAQIPARLAQRKDLPSWNTASAPTVHASSSSSAFASFKSGASKPSVNQL